MARFLALFGENYYADEISIANNVVFTRPAPGPIVLAAETRKSAQISSNADGRRDGRPSGARNVRGVPSSRRCLLVTFSTDNNNRFTRFTRAHTLQIRKIRRTNVFVKHASTSYRLDSELIILVVVRLFSVLV